MSISGSKSIMQRILMMTHASFQELKTLNASSSNDVKILEQALTQIQKKSGTGSNINIQDAGTPARFLLPLLCTTDGIWRLSGTDRMHKRPMADLIEPLRMLGMDIHCDDDEGFLPLTIAGKAITAEQHLSLEMAGNISSQFASAMALVSESYADTLQIKFTSPLLSKTYFDLSLKMLETYGRNHSWLNSETVQLSGSLQAPKSIHIESDWSSAAFWYCLLALTKKGSIEFQNLHYPSLQADSFIHQFFVENGILAEEKTEQGLVVSRNPNELKHAHLDFEHCPDLAPALIVCLSLLNCDFSFEGVGRLQYKESARLQATFDLLEPFGIEFKQEGKTWYKLGNLERPANSPRFDTQKDHRIAMAATLLASQCDIIIDDIEVVKKSYPEFWDDLLKFKFVMDLVE